MSIKRSEKPVKYHFFAVLRKMLNLQSLFLLLFLVSSNYGVEPETMSLWDQVIQKKHVLLTVEYHGRYLNVWQQTSHGYNRFYVTPLCVLDLDSISCSRDDYSHIHRHIFAFDLKLWDSMAAEAVKKALEKKNIIAEISDILPLPMQQVRIGLSETDTIPEVSNKWRSNQDQPHVMSFELYVRHQHFCEKMIQDAKKKTNHFLRSIKPYFEFTMVVGQEASRNVNITGNVLQRSSFFTELRNKNANKNGIVFLQSKDLSKLTRNIYNKAIFDEKVYAEYIPSNQEQEIITDLFNIF
jgi:hypothetical protein